VIDAPPNESITVLMRLKDNQRRRVQEGMAKTQKVRREEARKVSPEENHDERRGGEGERERERERKRKRKGGGE